MFYVIKNWIISRASYFRLTLIVRYCFHLVFKENHKTEELKYEGRWFCLFFCWQLQTRYHIFGLCQRCGRSWLEEEERTEAVLVFLSTRHLRRNSVTHLKPSK